MKILVVGSGGREHAIIRALKKSPKAETIYALPGNGGIAADAICVEGSATDIDRVVSFSKDNGIDFVVVAPDNPLVLGMVDALNEAGGRVGWPEAFAPWAHYQAEEAAGKSMDTPQTDRAVASLKAALDAQGWLFREEKREEEPAKGEEREKTPQEWDEEDDNTIDDLLNQQD